MSNRLDYIRDIIKTQLSLTDSQIMIYNQKYMIPTDPGLHITLSHIGSKVMSNNSYFESTSTGMQSVSQANIQEMIQIDIMSQDTSALNRKEEIILALNSNYSEKSQEVNNFTIFRIPTQFNDTSFTEASSMMTKFTLTIICFGLYKTTSTITDFYTDFSRSVPPQINVDL